MACEQRMLKPTNARVCSEAYITVCMASSIVGTKSHIGDRDVLRSHEVARRRRTVAQATGMPRTL